MSALSSIQDLTMIMTTTTVQSLVRNTSQCWRAWRCRACWQCPGQPPCRVTGQCGSSASSWSCTAGCTRGRTRSCRGGSLCGAASWSCPCSAACTRHSSTASPHRGRPSAASSCPVSARPGAGSALKAGFGQGRQSEQGPCLQSPESCTRQTYPEEQCGHYGLKSAGYSLIHVSFSGGVMGGCEYWLWQCVVHE